MLAAHANGEWIGLFPVVKMPSLPGTGGRAVSVAYCNYGGVVPAHGQEGHHAEILAASLDYLAEQGLRRVEVRQRGFEPGESSEVTLILPLPENSEMLWRSVGDKVRNQVRKATKSGLEVKWDRLDSGALHDVYAANMGRLGTPVHGAGFIEAIVREFGADAEILTVRLKEKVIGAMLLIKHGTTWADPIASSLPGYQGCNPNMLMYWEALRAACEQGASFFDFGRSALGSGTYKFKRQWGAVAYPLNYCSYKDGVRQGAGSTSFYRGSAGALVSSGWRRLPSFLQRSLGPQLRRWIP